MTNPAALLVYLSLPLVCVLALPGLQRPGGRAERFVYGVAVYETLLMAGGLLLGLTRHLTTGAYRCLLAVAAAALLVPAWKNAPRRLGRAGRALGTRRGRAALSVAALTAGAFALEVGFDALWGTRHFDGLWYHIPRLLFWRQQHAFDAWTTPALAQIGLPVGADLVLGHGLLLGGGWRGIAWVSCLLSVGAAACVYLAGLDAGLKRWGAAMSALLFAAFPAVGLRVWSVNSDVAAAFPAFAAFVALHRVRDSARAGALFLLLNGVAVACKPTIAPLALLLGAIALWRCRQKMTALRSAALPLAGALLAAGLVVGSYWPVYARFGDPLGGAYGRGHRASTAQEFRRAAGTHLAHWVVEPAGYVPRSRNGREDGPLKAVFNLFGAGFEELPEIWRPFPAQDVARTGLVPVLAAPFLLLGLRPGARWPATLLLLLGYVPLSGMIKAQPYASRYNLGVLAGFALLWGGTRLFDRGARRWLFVGVAAFNALALLGIVSVTIYRDRVKWSKPDGPYAYLGESERAELRGALGGRPLLVLTGDSMDALLAGPEVAYPLRYVIRPGDGNWGEELRAASRRSRWLAFVHEGRASLRPGPEFPTPEGAACPATSTEVLREELGRAGWTRSKAGRLVDLWTFD